jgi:low affinity Fe/Cu permease
MQLKLDDLIRAMEGAHLSLLDIEELSDHELAAIRRRYSAIARKAREQLRAGGSDTGTPDTKFITSE